MYDIIFACTSFNFPLELASSAASEAGFNNIKNRTFKDLPCRVDDFVQCHLDSLDGAMMLHGASRTEINSHSQENMYSTTRERTTLSENEMYYKSCIACSNGHFPDPNGNHICIVCKKGVHALTGCSEQINADEEGFGERRICWSCFSSDKMTKEKNIINLKKNLLSQNQDKILPTENKFKSHNSSSITDDNDGIQSVVFEHINDDEMVAVENWRGKGETKPPKKKKRTYFSNDSNALYIDLNSHVNKKSLGVILNGSSKKLKCSIINKNKIELLNTCAFDTLVQLFACAATDSIRFGNYIFNDNNKGVFFELLRHLIKSGVTKTIYDFRAKMLYQTFPRDELLRFITRVGCHCYITEMVNKILIDIPMAYEYHGCSNKHCERVKETVKVKCITYSSHYGHFGDLEVNINDLVKPTSSLCNENCKGIWTIKTILKDHVLIEVSNIPPGKNC